MKIRIKRISSLFLALIILILTISACGSEKIRIENYEWKMRSVMHTENDQLRVDAVDENDNAHTEAKIVDMTLTAKDGKIIITDATNNKTYEGAYNVSAKTPRSTDYHVTIDGISGYATVAMTTYADGTKEPTLPISIDGYSLYFYEK